MISIVMAYKNRLMQLDYTLFGINLSHYKDVEIVIVDDHSSDENDVYEMWKKYPMLNIKVIRMSDIYPEKTYYNPCVAYNIGFKFATGDKIIIQNPECMHVGDVLSYVNEHLTDENYIVFNCYAANKEDSEKTRRGEWLSFNDIPPLGNNASCWYNHYIIRPVMYHFTSAITRKNLLELGGFDEFYANGNGYDDDEFLHRIKLKKLKLEPAVGPIVLHQWHESAFTDCPDDAVEKNKFLFDVVTKGNRTWKINNSTDLNKTWNFNKIPKIAHFYWGGGPLSYLRYQSILSFKLQNPDWTVNLHTSNIGNTQESWFSTEQKIKYSGHDYINKLSERDINLVEHNLKNTVFEEAHHVHISDYLRWKLLYEIGGLWSDSDIIYYRPITNLIENTTSNSQTEVGLSVFREDGIPTDVHRIGFLLSSPGNNLFKYLWAVSKHSYDPLLYQSIGSNLLNFKFPDLNSLKNYFINSNIIYLNEKCVYPIHSPYVHEIYNITGKNDDFIPDVHNIGLHWFGGDEHSKNFETNYTPESALGNNTLIEKIIQLAKIK